MFLLSCLILSLASPASEATLASSAALSDLLEVIAEAGSVDCIDFFFEEEEEDSTSNSDMWVVTLDRTLAKLSWTFGRREEWRMKTGVCQTDALFWFTCDFFNDLLL